LRPIDLDFSDIERFISSEVFKAWFLVSFSFIAFFTARPLVPFSVAFAGLLLLGSFVRETSIYISGPCPLFFHLLWFHNPLSVVSFPPAQYLYFGYLPGFFGGNFPSEVHSKFFPPPPPPKSPFLPLSFRSLSSGAFYLFPSKWVFFAPRFLIYPFLLAPSWFTFFYWGGCIVSG